MNAHDLHAVGLYVLFGILLIASITITVGEWRGDMWLMGHRGDRD